ncbi:hypothetical protein PHMEG_00028845 [Phytophthora megakarya]|uniref:Uncharacterized protein n=1 Tax=Phytophthora megakarya TaxID=4795 RepID=A0A225V556_9STRA|nr:hypothetical protein PHMEG_00028845 [Phytophthora megakarya]
MKRPKQPRRTAPSSVVFQWCCSFSLFGQIVRAASSPINTHRSRPEIGIDG